MIRQPRAAAAPRSAALVAVCKNVCGLTPRSFADSMRLQKIALPGAGKYPPLRIAPLPPAAQCSFHWIFVCLVWFTRSLEQRQNVMTASHFSLFRLA